MATLKSEFLAQHNAHPRHALAVAAVRRDPDAQPPRRGDAPLSNLPVPVGLLGLAAKRPRPRFERETLIRWDEQRGASAPARR